MKRNTALFGASVVAGLCASAGLVAAAATSAAAPATAFGIAYATATGSSGFNTGAIADPDGIFSATAATSGRTSTISNLRMPLLKVSDVSIVTTCVGTTPQVTVTGGGAAGTYRARTTVPAAAFTGNAAVVGTVTFLSEGNDRTVGAFYDLTAAGMGENIQFGAVDCGDATTTSTTSTSTSSTSTSSTSTSSTPTGTGTSTSTSTPPAPTGTGTPPAPTGTPTGTAPPTPTLTTTRLPVAG